jgi:hypothetical protein
VEERGRESVVVGLWEATRSVWPLMFLSVWVWFGGIRAMQTLRVSSGLRLPMGQKKRNPEAAEAPGSLVGPCCVER